MRGTRISRLRLGARKLFRDQRGNALILTAAALIPVIGIVGSGIDIGRAYMTQLRLQQACDAGVLAGRRAMAAGTYTDDAKGEANKMFNFNFPDKIYGSDTISFTSQAPTGTADVTGTASARLPTALMYIFGTDQFNLSVNCAARLEIANTDVMLVLDVTGSMKDFNSGDKVNKITALHSATIDFFKTLAGAQMGDGRLRFGVVPYSSSANVGEILFKKNPAWLADETRLPSREAVTKEVWEDDSTVVSDDYTATAPVPDSNWTNEGTEASASNDKAKCEALKPWDDSARPEMIGIDDQNPDSPPVVDGSTRITVYDSDRTYRYYSYKYQWQPKSGSSWKGSCQIKKLRWTYVRTYQVTQTEILTKVFDDKYIYKDITFPVADIKNGTTSLVTYVGDRGQAQSDLWGGCVIERQTTDFASDETAPPEALDMNVDDAPTSDVLTQWQLLIPQIAFARASHPSSQPSTSGEKEVLSKDVTTNDYSRGSWQNYSKYWADGWGVCPAPAMKLKKVVKTKDTETATEIGETKFENYVNQLQPLGGTYHDAGMVWGIRLLSGDGMFADENAAAPNKRPIGRHIVFMTDGMIAPGMGNLSFQGYEYLMHRVGGANDGELKSRHNNRFQQLCSIAKRKKITIWVVSFGVGSNADLNTCASSGKAYEAANAPQLNEKFQSIARQISKLRLSE